jgi:hypothetical protein
MLHGSMPKCAPLTIVCSSYSRSSRCGWRTALRLPANSSGGGVDDVGGALGTWMRGTGGTGLPRAYKLLCSVNALVGSSLFARVDCHLVSP